jgi:MerR family transcriptional regulator, redox-sensitive transcriptional activator SoxR
MTTLGIGAVAERTGLSVSAVRYYDEIGVIAAAERVGGKRRFAEATIGRVNFIRRAQDAGFSLDEIRAILDDTRGEWRSLVDEKVSELVERQRQLGEMIDILGEMRACGCDVVAQCPGLLSCGQLSALLRPPDGRRLRARISQRQLDRRVRRRMRRHRDLRRTHRRMDLRGPRDRLGGNRRPPIPGCPSVVPGVVTVDPVEDRQALLRAHSGVELITGFLVVAVRQVIRHPVTP